MPDAAAADPASRAQVAAGLAKAGARVMLEAGHDASFFVQATDAQLDALAARLRGLYQTSTEQTRAWFQYADEVDLICTAGLIIDTATTRPDQLPVPRGWALAAGSDEPVYWIAHFAAPMGQEGVDWLAPATDESGNPGEPERVEPATYDAIHLIARMTAEQARQLRKRDRVDWVGRYEAVLKLGPGLGVDCAMGPADGRRMLQAAEARPNEPIGLAVVLFEPSPALIEAIAAEGGSVSEGGDNVLLVKGPRRLIRWLARRVEVQSLDVATVEAL